MLLGNQNRSLQRVGDPPGDQSSCGLRRVMKPATARITAATPIATQTHQSGLEDGCCTGLAAAWSVAAGELGSAETAALLLPAVPDLLELLSICELVDAELPSVELLDPVVLGVSVVDGALVDDVGVEPDVPALVELDDDDAVVVPGLLEGGAVTENFTSPVTGCPSAETTR